MTESKSKLEDEVRKGIAELETMRDEIRVNLHLAALDAKDKWRDLEPRVEHVKTFAREATKAARDEVRDLLRLGRVVRDAIRASKKAS